MALNLICGLDLINGVQPHVEDRQTHTHTQTHKEDRQTDIHVENKVEVIFVSLSPMNEGPCLVWNFYILRYYLNSSLNRQPKPTAINAFKSKVIDIRLSQAMVANKWLIDWLYYRTNTCCFYSACDANQLRRCNSQFVYWQKRYRESFVECLP